MLIFYYKQNHKKSYHKQIVHLTPQNVLNKRTDFLVTVSCYAFQIVEDTFIIYLDLPQLFINSGQAAEL